MMIKKSVADYYTRINLVFLYYRVKELESKVAERDAMIKVLQKHTSAAYDSGASLRNNSSREELGKDSHTGCLVWLYFYVDEIQTSPRLALWVAEIGRLTWKSQLNRRTS